MFFRMLYICAKETLIYNISLFPVRRQLRPGEVQGEGHVGEHQDDRTQAFTGPRTAAAAASGLALALSAAAGLALLAQAAFSHQRELEMHKAASHCILALRTLPLFHCHREPSQRMVASCQGRRSRPSSLKSEELAWTRTATPRHDTRC